MCSVSIVLLATYVYCVCQCMRPDTKFSSVREQRRRIRNCGTAQLVKCLGIVNTEHTHTHSSKSNQGWHPIACISRIDDVVALLFMTKTTNSEFDFFLLLSVAVALSHEMASASLSINCECNNNSYNDIVLCIVVLSSYFPASAQSEWYSRFWPAMATRPSWLQHKKLLR